MGADRLHLAACALLTGLDGGNVAALRSTLCEQARAVCVEAKNASGRPSVVAVEMEEVPVLETPEAAPRWGSL